jgi:hypothetical protein
MRTHEINEGLFEPEEQPEGMVHLLYAVKKPSINIYKNAWGYEKGYSPHSEIVCVRWKLMSRAPLFEKEPWKSANH